MLRYLYYGDKLIELQVDTNSTNLEKYGGRTLFGEKTIDNNVIFTIDGEETFRLIHDMINQAKSTISITSYDIDPKLHLIRNSELSHQHQSSSINEKSFISNKEDNKPNSNSKSSLNTNHILENLLIQKAIEGVSINILVWEPKFFIRNFPGSKARGIGAREVKLKTIRKLAKLHGVESLINFRIDNMAPTYTSGLHEKIIILDNKVGFCGGFDLMSDKWDTSSHDFDNYLRDDDYPPWHDIHFMITGAAIWDLIFHFNQRWTYSLTKNIHKTRNAKINSIHSFNSPYSLVTPKEIGTKAEIQAFRTWRSIDENKDKNYVSGIYSWYELLFKRAKNSIYIEDQFPFQDRSITQVLGQQLKLEKNLKVIIVGPMKPNLPGFFLSTISKESINDINNNLSYLREIGEGRVKTYSLVSQHREIAQKRQQIYVHSKLMIVDDCWMKIGSANMDKKGFQDSVEFDLGITSPELSKKLRIRLWKEHLNLKDDLTHTVNVDNFEEGYEEWMKLAYNNGKRVQNNEPINGPVYYYNFEEMNFPSPYLNAK